MAKVETFTFNRPNFLASEVGLVLKSTSVTSSSGSPVTENGRTIIKAGTVITTTEYGKGILFQDVDVTDKASVPAPVMVGGWAYSGKITGDVSSNTAIHLVSEPNVQRPYVDSLSNPT